MSSTSAGDTSAIRDHRAVGAITAPDGPRAAVGAALLGTGTALPSRAVDTLALLREALPHRDPVEMARRIGITGRRWLGPGETAASLGARALGEALLAADLDAGELKRVIFVSSTGGDHLIPATANSVCAALGLDDTCDAFDLNNSCAGFISALDVAARSVATGLGPVAVVVSETFSRYIGPSKPRPYLVLGDAAAAVIVGAPRYAGEGMLGSHLSNSAALRGRMTTRHPGVTQHVELIDFVPSSEELTASALESIDRASRGALAQAGLRAHEIAWWLPHQPNGEMLDRLTSGLGVPSEKLVPIVGEVGSVGAASIPLSIDRLGRSGRMRPGDLMMMAGVGSGTGYGAILWRAGGHAPVGGSGPRP